MARQRDYKAEYRARLERGRRLGRSAGVARGHPERGAQRASSRSTGFEAPLYVEGPDGPTKVVVPVSYAEMQRAGRYANAVAMLATDFITGKEFRRRVKGYQSLAGERLVTDPNTVLALHFTNSIVDDDFRYPTGVAAA